MLCIIPATMPPISVNPCFEIGLNYDAGSGTFKMIAKSQFIVAHLGRSMVLLTTLSNLVNKLPR